MKRLLVIFFLIVVSADAGYSGAKKKILSNLIGGDDPEKTIKREARMAALRDKRDGFKVLELGNASARYEDYLRRSYNGCQQLVGTAENCKTINLARIMARNNAINEYASEVGGLVKGKITTDVSEDGVEQLDNILAHYERSIQKEIYGEIVLYLTLVKKHNNVYDVKVYFLIDPDAALKAKRRAMKIAIEHAHIDNELRDSIPNLPIE